MEFNSNNSKKGAPANVDPPPEVIPGALSREELDSIKKNPDTKADEQKNNQGDKYFIYRKTKGLHADGIVDGDKDKSESK
jgi:hypothetical protein